MGSPNRIAVGRVWRFAQCEVDEIRRKLWVHNKLIQVQEKALDVLICLLEANGDPVTKDDLIEAGWETVGSVDDSSLTTAIRNLRKAFGDGDRESVIRTVHRVGYRIAVPIVGRIVEEAIEPEFRLTAGDYVPDLPDWRLTRPLDKMEPHRIWLAENPMTRRTRVFKFAEDGVRYAALKREITAARFLESSVPHPENFVKIADWRLTTKPYYTACEFGGSNLIDWAEAQRGTGGLARDLCLEIVAEVCDAVQQAHNLGLIHNDLKPSNILLQPAQQASLRWRVKIVDFGVATMQDPLRLAEAEVTNYGFGEGSELPAGGSLLYRAPEVSAGRAATQRADIYSIGVILFQLLSGDFTQIPTPGWEEQIDDPILRQDIQQAVSLDPTHRFQSAAEIAERLRSVEVRRETARLAELEKAENLRVSERARVQRARMPFIWFALVALVVGLSLSLWFYRKALSNERTAGSINDFLTEDLLQQSNPNVGRGVDETLEQAIQDASPKIEQRFENDPSIAAALHDTLAKALDNGQNYAAAGVEFEDAAADWRKADGPLSQAAIFDTLQHAFTEARSVRPGSLDRAKLMLSQQDALIAQLREPNPKVQFAKVEAQAMIAAADGRSDEAVKKFAAAADMSSRMGMSQEIRMSAKQRLCAIKLRVGDAASAETCVRELIAATGTASDGRRAAPPILKLSLAQSLLMQNKLQQAIEEVNADYPEVVKQVGAESTLTEQLLGVRSQAEGELEDWNGSIRDSLALSELAQKTEPGGFLAVGGLSDAALSECRAGRFASGQAHARDALKMVSQPGQSLGLAGVVQFTLASCLILSDAKAATADAAKLNDAERLLLRIDLARAAATSADPGWGANVQLALASIAYQRKQYATSRRWLSRAQPAFVSESGDRYQHDAALELAKELVGKGA